MDKNDSHAANTAIFLPEHEREDAHIVDVLIEERCPSFVSHWSWPVLRPFLYSMLGYKRAVKMADYIENIRGRDSFDYLSEDLDIRLDLQSFDRIPATGKVIIAANHPTGLADGVAVWEALKRIRSDILFFANADAIRVSPRMADVIIPVEWVPEKRSPAKAKETLRRAKEAFENEQCVVIFPSGRLAGMEEGELSERTWFQTTVTLARKQNCPIIPLNVDARNSWLYYFLSKVNGELRDITLFYELLNKKDSKFKMTAGPMIQPPDLAGDAAQVTEALKNYVAYGLRDDADLSFSAYRTANAPPTLPES